MAFIANFIYKWKLFLSRDSHGIQARGLGRASLGRELCLGRILGRQGLQTWESRTLKDRSPCPNPSYTHSGPGLGGRPPPTLPPVSSKSLGWNPRPRGLPPSQPRVGEGGSGNARGRGGGYRFQVNAGNEEEPGAASCSAPGGSRAAGPGSPGVGGSRPRSAARRGAPGPGRPPEPPLTKLPKSQAFRFEPRRPSGRAEVPNRHWLRRRRDISAGAAGRGGCGRSREGECPSGSLP